MGVVILNVDVYSCDGMVSFGLFHIHRGSHARAINGIALCSHKCLVPLQVKQCKAFGAVGKA
jgi:hypothetical protein